MRKKKEEVEEQLSALRITHGDEWLNLEEYIERRGGLHPDELRQIQDALADDYLARLPLAYPPQGESAGTNNSPNNNSSNTLNSRPIPRHTNTLPHPHLLPPPPAQKTSSAKKRLMKIAKVIPKKLAMKSIRKSARIQQQRRVPQDPFAASNPFDALRAPRADPQEVQAPRTPPPIPSPPAQFGAPSEAAERVYGSRGPINSQQNKTPTSSAR